jgi:Putative Actinobacterial Holin-X, holin superfamily III
MVDQATMNAVNGAGGAGEPQSGVVATSGRASAEPATSPSAGQVASNVAGFGENLLNMAELQVRMSAIELRQNVEALRIVAAVGLTGAIMALASLPIVLAGIAELLVNRLGLSRGSAFLIVGFTTLGLGSLCIISAGLWISRKRLGFPLSAEELARNLSWVRTVLRLSGRERVHRR